MGKSKWLRFLLVIPLLFVLVFTNVYIDPANIYHDYSKEIAESVLSGKPTHFGSSNADGRKIKHNFIMKMPDKTECIAVGPSLVMGVRSETVGTDSFYNLGMSGADFYDILAQFGLMEAYGKSADRVVFCVDSYFFDDTLFSTFDGHKKYKIYADYMISILYKQEPEKPQEKISNAEKEIQIRQLFSITYFQAAFHQIQTLNSYKINRERWGIVDKDYTDAYYMADASFVYPMSFQKRGVKDVREDCEEYDIEFQFSKGKYASEYCMEVFEKLVEYLLDKGIEVDLYLCPVAPSLWDRIEAEKMDYPILGQLEEYTNNIAKKYDLKITGSYNPYNLGMQDKDFYDSRHVRHELLGVYFDFTSSE